MFYEPREPRPSVDAYQWRPDTPHLTEELFAKLLNHRIEFFVGAVGKSRGEEGPYGEIQVRTGWGYSEATQGDYVVFQGSADAGYRVYCMDMNEFEAQYVRSE